MNRLIAWFADNPIAAHLIMLAIMIGGFSSIPHISKEFFPSSPPNIIDIRVPYPGAAPINVEQQICIRIENVIEDLEGIDKITSTAKKNICHVAVEAEEDYNIQTLLNDVKTRVESISTLPDEAERPVILQSSASHEMMSIALEGDVPESVLKRYAEDIKEEMEALPYVSTVEINGTRNYEINIEVSSFNLQHYQISLAEIQTAIQQSSIDLPVGRIKSPQGDILLQARNQAYSGDDFANIIIRKTANGGVLRLGDIATINDGFTQEPFVLRFNRSPALYFKLKVTDNPDVLKTNAVVTQYLEQKNQQLPAGMKLLVWHDYSVSFRDRIKTLVFNGVSGMILVFIVLMLFLRPLLALWVSVGIGISFLGALWLMPVLGVSLNMLSLFAFLLILGIVVDDAIIVSESIYNEQLKHGIGLETAKRGTQKVSKPIVFAVASTMIVFVPMLLLPGQSAEAAKAIPCVVLLALAFSLFESLFILPTHLADMPPEGHFKNRFSLWLDGVRAKFSNGLDYFIRKIYQPILDKALHHYGTSLACFTVAISIVMSIYIGGWIQYSFLPNVTIDYILFEAKLAEGEPFELRESLADRIENAAEELQQETLFSGTDISYIDNFMVSTSPNSVLGVLGLNRDYKSEHSSPEMLELWREKIGPIVEAESISYFYDINTDSKPLQYALSADNNDELLKASQLLQEYLKQFPRVYDITDTMQTPRSEIELGLKPSSEFSVWDMQSLSNQLRHAFYGTEAQSISRDGEDIKVMLRLKESERTLHESITTLPVQDLQGNTSRLDAVTDIKYVPALQDIKRINGRRTIVVSADLLSGSSDSMTISKDVMDTFSKTLRSQLPDVSISLEGEEEARQEFMAAWALLFMQTLLVIYIMMAIAFRSYWQPIIILTAIPFGAMGAILGHLIMGKEISIFSFLGVLACAGVVVNDNLVLIDRINQLRSSGLKKIEAIKQGSIDRFRPIILTSATTFIGLIPIMSETSLQAQFLIPMVISLSYGVLFATTVTLILVPCMYLLGEQTKESFSHLTFKLQHSFKKFNS